MNGRFLIERDLTDQDMADMVRWTAIRDSEVQRVVNVLRYFQLVVWPIPVDARHVKA